MAEEINPRTGKPYSKNPRAVSARRKRATKKSAEAQARAEEERGKQEIPQGEFERIPGYTGAPTYTDDTYVSPGTQLEQEGGFLENPEELDQRINEEYKQITDPKKPTEEQLLGESNTLESREIDVESLTNQQAQRRQAAENAPYDEAMRRAAGLTGRAKVAALKEANRLRTGDTGINPADIPDNALQAFNSLATAIADAPFLAAEELVEMKRAFDVGSAVGRSTGHPGAGIAAGVTWYAGEQLVDFLEAALRRRVYVTAGGPALPVGKTSYDDIIAQGAIILKSVSKGAGSNKKTGKFLNTPDKVRRDILLEKKKQPTLEELDQAVVRGGNEVQGWRYDRSSVEGFSDDLAKQLQKELGGTNAQRDAFQKLQKKAKSDLVKDIKALNKRMQFDYLEFANTAVQEGERLGRKLTDEDIYEIFTTMAKNPKNADMFDLGHNISAKNVARQKRKGKLTTADYASNMDIEIKKSIKDLIFRESKSGEIIPKTRAPMETSTSAKDSNVLRIVEKGNIARGSRTDAPKVVQLLKGVSPNIETEYLRFLDPQFDKILTDIIPHENHDEFMQFLRDGIKKWQGRGDDRLIGKQQLDQFPKKIRELVDDYLNLQETKPYQVLAEDIDTMKNLKIKSK